MTLVHSDKGLKGSVMLLLHPSVQMMLLLLGSQIAPVRMRRPHRLLYNHSGGKGAGNKTKAFLRQSDCCHVNNRQGNKGGISTGMFLIYIL